MAATFLEVCRAVAPDAVPAPGPHGAPASLEPAARARPVGWVRVLKPRVPAFDALDPGDLAIVPAAALVVVAPGALEVAGIADGLASADVAGVLVLGAPDLGAGVARDPVGDLLEALAARAVPVLVGPAADVGALERSAIAYLVNRRAELDRQARELEQAIEAHVLAGRGPEAIAASIAAHVGRPVVVERRRGEPLAVHLPADRPELREAGPAAVAAYHARPAAVPLRFPLPGADGRPVGAIVLLGDDPVRERERVALERIGTVVALALGGAPLGEPLPAAVREVLPAAGPPWVVLVARQAGEGVPDERLETRERLRRDLRLFAGPDRLVLRGDAASLELRAVVACTPDDPDALELAERAASILGRLVAVSRRFPDPGGRPAAEADARAALEAAERLPTGERPRLARAERLPAYRLLGGVHQLPDGRAQARVLLAPILGGTPAAARERLETLRAVLDGDAGTDVAAALGVHRNTVAYRLRRIEELSGWELGDPELRLALTLAIRLVQSEQQIES